MVTGKVPTLVNGANLREMATHPCCLFSFIERREAGGRHVLDVKLDFRMLGWARVAMVGIGEIGVM